VIAAAPTILLVEDDGALAEDMARALGSSEYTVWHAESAADARAVLKQARPDLIVLDLTLPDIDGLVFCTQLRTDAPEVPFMICSAATTAEKVLGFKLGAEDVLAKPFDLAELEARIEAILRRQARANAGPLDALSAKNLSSSAPDLGRLRVDLSRWRVTLDDRPLDLTPTEYQLLVYMTRRTGEIISRQDLARGVWGNERMSKSRTIDAYVRRVSVKLSDGGHRIGQSERLPRILSIRGLGYQLAVPLVTAA
jgi:DNA-binding response OmpR family regulator